MPITFPGDKVLTLYAAEGGGYTTVAPPASGLSLSAPDGFVDGQDLIITDSENRLGTKTNVAPMYYWDARENTNASSPLSRRSFTFATGEIDASMPVGDSAQSWRYTHPVFPATGGGVGQNTAFYTELDGAGTDITLAFKRRTNWDGLDAYAKWQELASGSSAWNLKSHRWWANPASGNRNNVVIAMGQENVAHGAPRITPEYTNTGTYDVDANATNDGYFGLTKNLWITDLINISIGDVDTVNSTYKWVANGEYNEHSFQANTTAYPTLYNEYRMPQAQFIYTDLDWYYWMGLFYLDDTQHYAVISDSATWPPSPDDKVEIQIPKAWAAGGATLNLRKGELTAISGSYLHLFNDGVHVTDSVGVLIA